ncbi:MAG TPA: sugar transferase [Terracidiphilus sp.]|nr:sugar transferase [Terracidiphilus sp.]
MRGRRNQDRLAWEFAPESAGSTTGTALSPWSHSAAKRVFDCLCVLAALPVLLPAMLLLAIAVLATSRGPVLFRQKRMGLDGHLFTIIKFRTLHDERYAGAISRQFTAIGQWLRRWKLDELPQLFNVLMGDMSLVGPRPKMREYELANPTCRPGITGAATLVFAREEELLECSLPLRSPETYRAVVMPAKLRLDTEYMERATFLSDVKLLVRSVLRRWDRARLQALVGNWEFEERKKRGNGSFAACMKSIPLRGPALPKLPRASITEAATEN